MAGMNFRRWLILVLSGVGLYSVANYSAEIATVRERKRLFNEKPFWLIAHRGFSGMYPENTMISFEKADELPIDALELDIHASKDGKLVVIHDPTLDRTTNMSGQIVDYSAEELRRADAGYHFDPSNNKTFPFRGQGIKIPFLEELFQRFPHKKFVVEIKQTMPAIEELLVALIRKYHMEEKVIVASEHYEPLARIRAMDPELATNLSAIEARAFYTLFRMKLSAFYKSSGDALQIPDLYKGEKVVTQGLVKAVHKKGLILHIWTVNDPQEMKQLIDYGVDGIITDYPDRLAEVISK
ncbi:glycerophosphodiester phosphodiesterase [bacterium]|nr:glycerophosphodiester phosphodiesterase [bacterium]